jgi:taurine dioxygenase
MATRNWQVKRLSAALGAEVTGVTLANADAAEAADIRRLLHEHLVLFFPGQFMSAEDHIAFGRHFGVLEGHPNLKAEHAQGTPRAVSTRGEPGRHRRRMAHRPHLPASDRR